MYGERSDRQGPSSLATRHDRAASKNPVKNVVGKRGQKLETGLMLFAANSKNHDRGFFFLFIFAETLTCSCVKIWPLYYILILPLATDYSEYSMVGTGKLLR